MIRLALTRDFKQTVVERVQRDPAFARTLLDEAANLFLNDEPETARPILRDLVNATIGFEVLAEMIIKPSKSLHRRLSQKGNPSMDSLAAIFGAALSASAQRKGPHQIGILRQLAIRGQQACGQELSLGHQQPVEGIPMMPLRD